MSRIKTIKTPGDAAAEPVEATPEPVSSTALPNAVDIDARFIRGPVLTRQGYVVPDEPWQKANPAEFQAALKAQA